MKQLQNLLVSIRKIFSKNNKADENQDTFNSICDIFYYAIKNGDEKVAKTISEFMYDEFDRIRRINSAEVVKFPIQHYNLTSKLTLLLAKNDKKEFDYLKVRSAGGLWLLGEREGKISEETYSCLWYNLKIATEYEDRDMITAFWINAHEHISYRLNYILPDYVSGEYPKMNNQKEYEDRIEQRKRFLQFIVALGGLLIYSKQYDIIQRCFKYTQDTPPKYDLLPETMNEIFEYYIHFLDPYSEHYPFMEFSYSFPRIEGFNADKEIKRYICKYIAVLFLRQYSITPYLSYMEPLAFPNIPKEQGEIKKWIENIDYFKLLVEEVYQDKQLLNEVGFGWLTNEWFIQNEKPHPLQFIDEFKKQLEQAFDINEKTQNLSKDKFQEFLNSSKKILERTFSEYDKLNNRKALNEDVEKGYIFGSSILLDRSVFADNQGVSNLNFDSILAGMISDRVKEIISNSFLIHRSAHYVLSPIDIFRAIDRLDIDSGFVLIAFRLNFHHLINELKIEGLTENSYKGVEIRHFEYANYQTVANTIFLIKESDLPRIVYLDTSEDDKKKYDLTSPINSAYNLYANVIDLNKNIGLRTEEEKYRGEDLSKKVLACIAFKIELQWKRNIDCISLRIYSEYTNTGILNNINDVKPIKKKPD